MAKLADTTIRLLGQEPLAGSVPTAELLRLAEVLDRAGFAYLEVCLRGHLRRAQQIEQATDFLEPGAAGERLGVTLQNAVELGEGATGSGRVGPRRVMVHERPQTDVQALMRVRAGVDA